MAILRSSNRRFLVAAFIVALLARAGAVVALHAWRSPMAWENGAIAKAIAAGEGFSFDYSEGEISNYYSLRRPIPTSFQAPFYPYVLAGTYALARHVGSDRAFMLLLFLQAVVGAALVFPVAGIARKLSSDRAAVVGVVIAAVYPAFVYDATVTHQAVWVTTGFAYLFLALLALKERPTVRRAVVFGAVLGVSLLMEPAFLALIGMALLGAVLAGQARRRIAAAGALGVAVSLLVASPWLARCYMVHGRFVFIKSSTGFNLWQGNNPASNGTPHSGWKHVAYPAPARLLARLKRAGDEIHRDDIWRAAAVAAIKANPAHAAALAVEKAVFFWTITPYHPLTGRSSYWLPYAVLFVAALAAMVAMRGRLKQHLPSLLAFGAATILYSITFPGPRYRMPLEPLLFLFSAEGLVLASQRAAGWAQRIRASHQPADAQT